MFDMANLEFASVKGDCALPHGHNVGNAWLQLLYNYDYVVATGASNYRYIPADNYGTL